MSGYVNRLIEGYMTRCIGRFGDGIYHSLYSRRRRRYMVLTAINHSGPRIGQASTQSIELWLVSHK